MRHSTPTPSLATRLLVSDVVGRRVQDACEPDAKGRASVATVCSVYHQAALDRSLSHSMPPLRVYEELSAQLGDVRATLSEIQQVLVNSRSIRDTLAPNPNASGVGSSPASRTRSRGLPGWLGAAKGAAPSSVALGGMTSMMTPLHDAEMDAVRGAEGGALSADFGAPAASSAIPSARRPRTKPPRASK